MCALAKASRARASSSTMSGPPGSRFAQCITSVSWRSARSFSAKWSRFRRTSCSEKAMPTSFANDAPAGLGLLPRAHRQLAGIHLRLEAGDGRISGQERGELVVRPRELHAHLLDRVGQLLSRLALG